MDDLTVVEAMCRLSIDTSKARRERVRTRQEKHQEMLRWVAIAILVVGVCTLLALTPWYT